MSESSPFLDAFLRYVIPSLGVVFSCALYAAPMKVVLAVKQRNALLHVNPLPFPILFFNAINWTAYGLIAVHDHFIVCSNSIQRNKMIFLKKKKKIKIIKKSFISTRTVSHCVLHAHCLQSLSTARSNPRA